MATIVSKIRLHKQSPSFRYMELTFVAIIRANLELVSKKTVNVKGREL